MKFFVYGTLKSGYGNNRILQAGAAQLLGVAESLSDYLLINMGCPGAILQPVEGAPVRGELYEVDNEETVQRLDRLEGNGRFYTRYERQFTTEDGATHTAWIYELPKSYQDFGKTICPIIGGCYEWN